MTELSQYGRHHKAVNLFVITTVLLYPSLLYTRFVPVWEICNFMIHDFFD